MWVEKWIRDKARIHRESIALIAVSERGRGHCHVETVPLSTMQALASHEDEIYTQKGTEERVTTKQRLANAVHRDESWHENQSMDDMEMWAIKLILAERARMKRKIKRVAETKLHNAREDYGYQKAIYDILKLLEA